ncbi:MAG: dTMP kinase [Saprospiraceae bacterium]|nr:dTMP kinase [Saprospiraceae bacterium]
MMQNRKGKLIVFEGIDGSGKSTQIKNIAHQLEHDGFKVITTAEPTTNPIGKTIRQIFSGKLEGDQHVIAALFAADRLDHIFHSEYGMLHLLDKGYIILCDRYYLSSLAYHSVHVPYKWVLQLNTVAMQTLKPDMHIFIDISPDESMQRIHHRNDQKELYETLENLQAVYHLYQHIVVDFKDTENIVVVDGTASKESVFDTILNHIKSIISS